MAHPVRILTYQQFEGLWSGAIQPWMQAARQKALFDPAPWVIVCPDVVRRDYLKQQLVQSSCGTVLGVRFLTPGQLRTLLLKQAGLTRTRKLATGEDLQYIARQVAAVEAKTDRRFAPLSKDASGFTRAWDGWTAARANPDCWGKGWNAFRIKFEQKLAEAGMLSTAQADWTMQESPPGSNPLIGNLLIWGFSYDQADLYPLLLGAASHAREATLAFPPERESLNESVWLGSFEQAFHCSADLLPGTGEQELSPLTAWAQAAEFGLTTSDLSKQASFKLFNERESEAAYLVSWAEDAIHREKAARIAIVLPRNPILAREVVRLAQIRKLPIHDAIGYFPVAPLNQRLFAAWIAYQKTARIGEAQRFLELLPYMESGQMREVRVNEIPVILREWEDAMQNGLSTNVSLIGAMLPAESLGKKFLEQWPVLSSNATPNAFLEEAQPVLEAFGFSKHIEEIIATWKNWNEATSRAIWIDWLYGSLRIPGKQRAPEARNSFAPIQIIHYHQIGSQKWTHLAFGGMNEGLVPAVMAESPYWNPDTPMRHLLQSKMTGVFGEGHETLQPGKGFLPGEHEQRTATWRGILDAISSTSHSVICTAVWNEDASDRQASVLSQPFLQLLQAAQSTQSFNLKALVCRVKMDLKKMECQPSEWNSVEQTRMALQIRYEPKDPFNGYSYCREELSNAPISLPSRQWEYFLSRPASVWLQACCHLRPIADLEEGYSLRLMHGNQVHRLLAVTTEARTLESLEDWRGKTAQLAQQWFHHALTAYQQNGQTLPRWWQQAWGSICQDAYALIDVLNDFQLPEDTLVHNEWILPPDAEIHLSDDSVLGIRGKVDCLLEIPARDSIIIDFKTGNDTPMTLNSLKKGKGLQVLIYGLGYAEIRNQEVGLSILTPRDASGSIQISVQPHQDPSDLLSALAQSVNMGLFGESENIRTRHNDFVGNYPLTAMKLPRHIWVEKWNRTHPLLQIGTDS